MVLLSREPIALVALLAGLGSGDLFRGGGGHVSLGGGGLANVGEGYFYGGGSAIGVIVIMVLFAFAFSGMRRGGWRGGPWGGGGGPWGGGGGPWGGGRGPWGGGRGSWGDGQPGGGQPGGGGWGTGSQPAGGDWGAQGAGERLSSNGASLPRKGPDWMHDDRPAAASIPGELFPQPHAQAVQAVSPVDVGLAAIKAHDPAFGLEQFTQQVKHVFFFVQEAWSERKPEMSRQVMADSLWQQHRAELQGYIDGHRRNMLDYLAVSNIWPVAARSDQQFDTITMRIAAACADYDVDDRDGRVVRGKREEVTQREEDWTFQRSSRATTQPSGGVLGTKCPNCAAPLDIDPAGTCRYCKARVMSGDYGWVLARISPVV